MACPLLGTGTPPVEAHRPVLTYLQFPIQVCFPCNDHAQPAADKALTSVNDTLVVLIVVRMGSHNKNLTVHCSCNVLRSYAACTLTLCITFTSLIRRNNTANLPCYNARCFSCLLVKRTLVAAVADSLPDCPT